MANSLINNSIITREALTIRRNTNDLVKNIDRKYESQFAKSGAKIGDTINVRLPNDYTVQDGPTVSPESTAERSIPLTVNYRKNVPMSFSTQDRTLKIDDFSRRYIAPAVNALLGQVASDVMTLAKQACNVVRNVDPNSGATITPSSATWLRAKALLTSCNAPLTGRHAVLDPNTDANTVAGMMGMFNPGDRIGRQTIDGEMGSKILGVDSWMQDQTVLITETGTYNSAAASDGTYGNYTASGASVPPTTISSSASPHSSVIGCSAISGSLNAGDVITIDGVYRVNRITKQSQYVLQQFVVLQDVGSGATSIPVSPAIIPPSDAGLAVPYQTVSAAPILSSTIRLVGSPGEVLRRNMLYNEQAMTLATVDLEMVDRGVVDCARDSLDGVSLRTLTYYNGSDDTRTTRLDALYGIAMLRPDWVVIVPEPVDS